MGLGKTAATLTAVSDLMADFEVGRVLVIAPPKVAALTWPQEVAKWSHIKHLTYTVLNGPPAKREQMVLNDKSDIHLISQDLVVWLVDAVRRLKMPWPYDLIVIDEASSFKSWSSKRFKWLRKVAPAASRVIELTGTPAGNGLLDVWSQIFLLDQGDRLHRTLTTYRDRYFKSDYMGYNWTLRKDADKEIYDKLSDLCITLKTEDYLDLPDIVYNVIEVELPPAARKIYEDLEKDLLAELEEETVAVQSAAALANKLRQCACGGMYTDDEGTWSGVHAAKLDAMQRIYDEAQGSPLLVAYDFRFDKERLAERFKQAATELTDQTLKGWNRGDIPMLIAHPASVGHGLNLQAGGNIVVWYGLTWSLERYQQLNARLHRQGQTEPVIVHHIITKDTVDETVLAALERKDTTQRALLDAMKLDLRRKYGKE